jgi:hypothetical protein
MPTAPSVDSVRSQSSEREGVPSEYVYLYIPLSSSQFCTIEPHGKDCKHNKKFVPDFLTDKGPATG